MNRRDWLLLAIGDYIEPIQLQKTLFKFARETHVPVSQRYGFVPYNWGPMAKQVYEDVDFLQMQGLVEARKSGEGWSAYRLTEKGSQLAANLRESAPRDLVKAMDGIREWVMQRSFRALLRDVYEQYPEMATKSLFKP